MPTKVVLDAPTVLPAARHMKQIISSLSGFQVSFCQIWALIIDARQLAPIVHKCVTGFLTKREKKGCLFIFIWIHEIRGGRKEKLPKRLKVEVTAAK